MASVLWLAELTVWNPNTASTTVLRFSNAGFTTSPADTPANTFYDARVSQAATLRRNLFSEGKTSGRSQTGYGDLVLVNGDGQLDYLIDYGFDGRALRIYRGSVGDSYTTLTTTPWLVATMMQPEFRAGSVTISIRDRQALVDVPLQATKYAGTNSLPNGLEGVAGDLKGKPKPIVYGSPLNVTAILVNSTKLIYQINDGAVSSIPSAYDRAIALGVGAIYASSTDLLDDALQPAAGTFKAYPAGGYFRLGATPAGVVTCDVVQGATAADRTAAQIYKAILLRIGLLAGDYSAADITALDAANPSVLGFIATDEMKASEALDAVAASVGAWWGPDKSGVFRIKQLTAPSGTPVVSLTQNDVVGFERIIPNDAGRGLPVWKYILRYQQNSTVQEVDFLDLALSARARIVSTTATAAVVRVAVADPYPQGTASATVTYQDVGSGGVTPSSGGTATPANSFSEAAGTYIDYTITRPAFAAGSGRVTFTATAGNRTSATDAIDIPAQEKTAFGPALDVAVAPTATNYVVTWSGTGTAELSIDGGAYAAPPASPITITRNAVGGADKLYAFRATNDSRAVTNTVTVPAQLPATQDALPDGSTYARIKAAEMSAGQVKQTRDTVDAVTFTVHAGRREQLTNAMFYGS